ncbi:sigma-70 family RNA polymerase sigma factor [bacterium]|nr:sigma-70 family RNA polymerase sigma factor [bacterium]
MPETTSVSRASAEDDATLVRRALGGERTQAFRVLYERHKDAVFAFLVRFLRDRGMAEDVSQDAFLRVYRALDRFDPQRPFRPWLHQIVRHAAIDALRVRRKHKESAAGAAAGLPRAQDDEVVSRVSHEEQLALAREAFDALPDEPRALLFQKHGLGMSLDELASSWACTDRTIRNRLHAAARELAACLARTRPSKGDAS